jgi:hypothetical protein
MSPFIPILTPPISRHEPTPPHVFSSHVAREHSRGTSRCSSRHIVSEQEPTSYTSRPNDVSEVVFEFRFDERRERGRLSSFIHSQYGAECAAGVPAPGTTALRKY